MTALSDQDVEKLFSGAPQYFARAEGHYTGAPHPSVAYPWDEALEIRDLTDHTQIADEAWSCVTAWPHITRDRRARRRRSSVQSLTKRRAHFYPRCRERPSMLSMQGLEKGTIGYQAALEMAVADALQEEQFGFDSLGPKAKAVVEARQKLLTSKDGLRHMDETKILEELIKNGRRYQEAPARYNGASTKLYNELFNGMLHPPTRVVDHHDPYGLTVQIQALLKVLATPNVWVDFSHVEWRIRLGQVLWAPHAADDIEDGSSIHDVESVDERHEERYWLLLQILLSCELLARLDAITEGEELGIESIKPSEIHRFERDANGSVKWSLILARTWLENIDITKTGSAGAKASNLTHHTPGWLATLTKRMSLSHESGSGHRKDHDAMYAMKGRFGERQVYGLTHFARELKWPDIESYAPRITENCRAVTEGTPLNTPLATPLPTSDSKRSSYFGGTKPSRDLKRQPSKIRKVAAALHPSGWLSKSYISGLMLPGEGISHFLMSTLLENDKEAMAKLGPMANLCGGFVYCGKSFWSTACIVGRVLAAANGSAECMGWISSDVIPQKFADGWVNIEVHELRDEVLQVNKKARIWGKSAIERESALLGHSNSSSILPTDFILPCEDVHRDPPPANAVIELKSFDLYAPTDSMQSTPTQDQVPTPFSNETRHSEIHTYPAALSFVVTREDGEASRDYTFTLANDIHFVTAHPCTTSHHVRIMKSPTSPTIEEIQLPGSDVTGRSPPHNPLFIQGHPLHKSFNYTSIYLSHLLDKKDLDLNQLLQETSSTTIPQQPSQHSVSQYKTSHEILVIDCITGFKPQPPAHEVPLSPVVSRSGSSLHSSSPSTSFAGSMMMMDAENQEHHETRRRRFGSDMEILVRALCAEKGWNAIISRRRRGCLACAIREARALGWRVVIRVD